MNVLKTKIMSPEFSLVDSCAIELPEWVTHVTLEYGILTGWDNEPQYKNGTFYADPLFYTEELYTFKNDYNLSKPYTARCDVVKSKGSFVLFTAE